MNFSKIPDINSGVFSMEIKFLSYGNTSLTEDEEKAILDAMPTKLQYKNIDFSGMFQVVNNEVVEVTSTYTNNLSITLPTNVIANPVSAGNANVVIGTKTINVSIADITNGIATTSEIQNGILNAVKSDSTILSLFSASDINVSNGKIVASVTTDTNTSIKVSNINAVYGNVVSTITNLPSGDLVKLSLNNKVLPIDSTFDAKFEIDSSKISTSQLGTYLTTPELVCQAYCYLFRNRVVSEADRLVLLTRSKANNFETESVETI